MPGPGPSPDRQVVFDLSEIYKDLDFKVIRELVARLYISLEKPFNDGTSILDFIGAIVTIVTDQFEMEEDEEKRKALCRIAVAMLMDPIAQRFDFTMSMIPVEVPNGPVKPSAEC